MHVAICPAESSLENLVKFTERQRRREREQTGDRWVKGEDIADKDKVVAFRVV